MRKGDMLLAAFGRKSKDQPMDSAKYVISASFKNGMFSVSYIEYFATEQEASAAVKAWNEEAGRGFVREKGRENEYWTTTCPDGTKIIAHGFALKASAMFSVLFVKK
ncbi:MAG: hypothetical protein JSS89_03360 [Bacteroidetes bacterium]|nr:hypothetical protein [Bacteroidota bacterium]